MPRLRARRPGADDDVDIDMVPIMNMFLVLIPFLLMSANFLHLKGINTSVPVQAEPGPSAEAEPQAKVTVVVQLEPGGIRLSALSDAVPEPDLEALAARLPSAGADGYPWDALRTRLQEIKARYPRSDTMILIPHGGAQYGTVVRAMDTARRVDEAPLFPNVVLSGKVG